jgi:thermitase
VFSKWLSLFTLSAALMISSQVDSAEPMVAEGSHIAGELLVKPRDGVSDNDTEQEYKKHGGQKIKTFSQLKVHHIRVPEHALEKIEAALKKNPKIEFVEKNFVGEPSLVPNDPSYANQWHLARMSAPAAWNIATGSSNMIIAVPDSGIDLNHPDLPSVVAGKNFVNNTNNVSDNGVNYGHGTAVSGAAAAAGNNSIGVSGVSWRNPIMPLVVLDPATGQFTYTRLISAINYAADNGAKIISMSLAGPTYSSALQAAVNYAWEKGLVLIAAAGNKASNVPLYPAALDNVISVSATDSSDHPATFTNYGDWIDVAAPGVSIRTTMMGGGYGNWNGTSLATPQVAGLAALILSANPGLTNAQVVELIKKNADDLGSPGFDHYYGFGRINAYRSLVAAGSAPVLSASISSPSNGTTVSGVVTVNVSVSSQNPISKVELHVDGQYYAVDNAGPYAFNVDTSLISGTHSVFAKVFDTAGNVASSSTVSFAVSTPTTSDTTPPQVQITGIFYDGKNLTITASASDANGAVTKVQFYVDGVLKVTDTAAPWSAKINAKPLGQGVHEIKVKAYDQTGNAATSGTGSVTTTR